MRTRYRDESLFGKLLILRKRRTKVKKLVLHVLMTMFLAAVALSQEGYSKGNPAAGPLPGPFPDRTTTLSFESDEDPAAVDPAAGSSATPPPA